MHLILNATVHAPELLGVRHLLVAGERIVWMGETAPSPDRAFGAEVIDVEGRHLIPGLVDCHAHLTGGGGEAGFTSRVPPLALSRFTRGGTTTVIGLLGTDDVIRSTASLVARARALTAEGISAFCLTGGYHLPPTTLTGSVRDDILHVDPVVGVGEIAISDHRSSQPTLDELLRVAADAHVAGMLSGKAGVVHVHLGGGERGLALVRDAIAGSELPACTFHPTHVNRRARLFQEAMDLAEGGTTIDVSAFAAVDHEDELGAAEALRLYREASLPAERITVSSDGGGSTPRFDDAGRVTRMGVGDPALLGHTLAEILRSGVPHAEALPPFTSNVASLYRLEAKGRVRVGGDADLVLLDEGHRVTDVMARGRWHVRAGQVLVRGTFEEE